MPDFDKNLQPIIKDSSIPFEHINIGAPKPAAPINIGSSDFSLPTLAHNDKDVFAILDNISKTTDFNEKGMFVTNATLKANQRYKEYNPIIANQEDFAAYGQVAAEKAFNGIVKGANLVGTTIAGGFGMLYGAGKAMLPGGKFSDIWDNPIMQQLDEWNNKVDQEYLPNYYTDKEKNAEWYQRDNWMTTNFLFDKLIKNSGFAVGAMVSGNIANGVLGATGSMIGGLAAEGATLAEASQGFKLFTPLLRNTARAFSAAKNIEAAGILEKEISSIADITARSSKLADIAKSTMKFSGINDTARRTAIAAYSSAGEASFEALQTSNEYKKSLIQKYTNEHGHAPTGVDLDNINDLTASVGATSFLGNMALLTVTEFQQLPNLLGSSYKTTKNAANSLLGDVEHVVLKDGKYIVEKELPTTVFGKSLSSAKRVGGYMFDPKEAGQEIGQYAIQTGTQHYFEKGKQNRSASDTLNAVLESVNFGLFDEKKGALRSKEGIEGGIIGGITGGIMENFGPSGKIAEAKHIKTNTERFISGLDNAPTFQQAFVQRMESINRGVALQKQYQDAVIQGDKLEALDAHSDMMHNYLTSRINYGRFDMVMDDIAELKQMGITKEGLDILKEQGIGNIEDTVDSFQKRLNSFEQVAKNTNKIIKSTNLRFSGEILKDENNQPILNSEGKQTRKYSPAVIDKLVYAASKIADYDIRIPEVSAKLMRANIPVQDVVNDELSNDTSVSLAKVLYNIDQQKSDRIDTDLVKQEIKDVVELSKRRQQFVNEYNDLKDNSEKYTETGEKEEFTPEGKKTRTTTPTQSDYFSKSRDKFKSDKRTYDDIVKQYGEGEKSKYEVLQKISESPYATTLEKQLATAFLNFTGRDSKIILGDRTLSSAGVSRGGTLGKESAVSSINYEDNAADYENGSLPVEHVLLHEIGHDLTVYGLSDTNGQFFKELDPLFKFVQETFKNDPNKYAEAGLIKDGEYYAFKNIFEFATEALSNREFQRYLQTIPYKNTKTSTWDKFVDSLKTFFRRLFGTNNENLLNETIATITNHIDETYKSVKEKNAALEKEEQALLSTKNDIDRQQDKAEINSGEIATPIPTETTTAEAIVKEDESYLKSWQDFFISGTSESENAQNRANAPQHVKNSREFLNNVKNFKNVRNIGAMLVTSNNEEALGLKGLTELQFGVPLDTVKDVNNIDTGFVAQVFVEHKNGKTYFVNKAGERLGEVGKQIDVNQAIYQAMPTTELYYTYTDPKTGQRVPRYRQGEKELLTSAANGWRQERAKLFANTTAEHKVYAINISRGIPIINKVNGKFERNQVGGILIPEEIISSQAGLIQINTAGFVSHKGKNISFKEKGIVILQYGDTLEILNNSILGKEKANSLYQVIKALALDIREKSVSGKPLDIDVNYLSYLQNVLYLRKSGVTSGNQFFIDTNKRTISLGGVNYPIIDIENKEAEIVRQLADTYHNINSKTIKDLTSKFYEYTGEKNDKGELVARHWKNYQSYLLSGRLPDGRTSRSNVNTPLTTIVAAPTLTVPYSFSQKYATLVDFGLPLIKSAPVVQVAKPIAPTVKQAPTITGTKIGEYDMNGTTVHSYPFANGPVEFTGTVDTEGNISVDLKVNDTIEKAAENAALLESVINPAVEAQGKLVTPDNPSDAEQVKYANQQNVVTFVGSKLIFELDKLKTVEESPEAEEVPELEIEEITPEDKTDAIDLEDTNLPDDAYMRVGVETKEEVLSKNDIQILKDFQVENLPGVPLEVLEDLVDTYDGEKAFGVYVDGVVKFYKAGPRTVGYHELFHPVYKHFLTSDERVTLNNEFRNKPGQFIDRASGKKIDYANATDEQIEERIADDFAEFKVGKLPARSLSELVRNFFKRIIDFVKSINSKPSLAKDLFKAIDAGKYKAFTISEAQKKGLPAYSRIPGITETQASEYAQDIFARASNYIFGENKKFIFDLQQITGAEIYDYVKQAYIAGNVYQKLGEERFNALFTQGKQLLRTIGVNFNEEDLIDINDENVTTVGYSQEAFTVDYKKTSPFAIKLVAATLPEVVPTNQQNSTSLKLPERTKSSIGGFKLVNFSRVFATLLDKVANTTKIGSVVKKLVDLSKYDATYVRFFQRVGGNLADGTIPFENFKTEDWRLFINFYQTFTKQKPNVIVQYVVGTEVYSAPANQFTINKQVEQDWFSQMRALAKTPNGLVRFNSPTETYQVNTTSQLWPSKLPKGPEEMIDFLKNLGVTFNIDDYLKLKSEQRDDFSDTVGEIYNYLPQAKDIGTLDGKTLKINKQISKLAELQVKVTNPNQENTLMGVEGNKRQAYVDNNAPSFFENSFNDSQTLQELKSERPELNDVFSKNSIILKKGGTFFNDMGDRFKMIKVSYIEGKKLIDSNKGITTGKLTEGQRFTQGINENINGRYYVLIPADGSTEWMMNLGNHVSYINIVGGRAMDEIHDIFRGYLDDDIALARDWRSRSSLRNLTDNGENPGKAKELRFFKEILEVYAPEQLQKLNIMIDDNATTNADFEDYISKNSDAINNAVIKSIEDVVAGTKEALLTSNEVMMVAKKNTDVENMYKYPGLDSGFALKEGIDKFKMTETQLNNMLMFVNSNNYINNIELHKILFGDPYQFATKKGRLEQTKRTKSFLSPRRVTFNSDEFNEHLDESNVVNGIQLTPDDYGYHEHKAFVTTVSLKDIKFDTINYKGVNEADAFSLISDVNYKEVKSKNGQWPDSAEAWHQWQMSFTRTELAKKGVYTYSKDARGKALKNYDEGLISTQQPEHVIDIIKPIVSGNKANENEFNLVLDKTSQMPIYYSAVMGTNLERLYIKMFKEKIDYAIMESGRKVGIEDTHSLYNLDKKDDAFGTFNDSPFAENTKVEVPWSSYGIQLETSYEGGGEQTRGSQPTKIVTLDMFDNGEEVVEGAKEAFDVYNQTLKDLDDNAYSELLSKFGTEDLGVGEFELVDPSIMAKTLEQELFRRQLSNNAKDTIQLDKNGQWRLPFESSPAYKQIKDIVYSMINKSLVSPKMNGGGYVQAAVTGWESAKEGRSIAIKEKDGYRKISREEYNALPADQKSKVVLTSDRLHFPTQEDPYMEVLLPNHFKKDLKGKFGNNADLIKELNKPENQGILRGIAFRIPAQAMSSMAAIRIAGFLPDYMGKTVIVPSEITSQAGSDFDIDKLNMYLKSIYVDENGRLHAVDYKGSEKATKEFYGKVYDNTIKKSIEKIANSDQFRKNLLNFFENTIATSKAEALKQQDFYDTNEGLINEIISQADAVEMSASEYMTSQIESLSEKTEKLNSKLLSEEMRDKYIKKMYKKALENRYFDAFEKLLTLPGNFKSLITPIGDAGLEDASIELDRMRNADETRIKNRILNRNYLTKLRHAFLSGKRWVGIAAVNITGHALAQRMKLVMDINKEVAEKLSSVDRFALGNREIKLPHNKIDGKTSLSGTKTVDGKQFISNRLSGYATSVVDIANNPYIMKVIKSDAAIGTFMFLERIGVGENTVWFMNQPIITEYLNYIESKGTKFLYNEKNIDAVRAKFGLNKTKSRGTENEDFNVDTLKSNIETYYNNKNKMLSAQQNAEQGAILKEFLKYSKMAEFSFKFTQATNYDTTKFKNSDTFHRKSTKTDIARDVNIFSSVDELLDSSSIGNQKRLITLAMKSVGSFIKLEQEKFTDITNQVLDSFERQEFISDDDFSKIASKVKASFLDFIIQTKSGLNSEILDLTTGNNSIAEQLAKAKLLYPNMRLLQDLVPESSKKSDGAQTIKLKVNLKEAYDENLYVEMLRELRQLDPVLYNNIVKVAILQGTHQSPVSINNIIPIEDYSKTIKPIIDTLVDDVNTEYFTKGSFQKNSWKDEQVVPTITPRFQFQRDEDFEEIEKLIGEDPYGNDVYEYETQTFETQFDDAENKRLVLTLSPMFDGGNGANSDFVKVSRVFVNKKGQNVDLITGRTISSQAMKAMRMAGNTSLTDYYGYQKVKYSNGTPVRNWEGRYVYKLVNLLGDGNLVSEYYLDARPSVLNNGTIKITKELSDADIINHFGGDISEEDVSLPTEEVIPEVEYTVEEQLQFEINDLTQRIAELEYIQKDLDVTNTETIVLDNLPKITPISAKKETGAKVGTKSDISPSLLSGNGVSVDQAAHNIWENNFGIESDITTQDIRDIIIDILSSGSKGNYKSQIGTSSEITKLKDELRDLKYQLDAEKVTKSKEIKSVPKQLTLFEQMFGNAETFDTIEEFTPERKEEILKNFADKHKMTTAQAKEYINTAIAENKEEVINKLKDCY